MNVSLKTAEPMNAPSARALAEELPSDRRTHILDAAERSFIRGGFHGTSMQDVAAEAGMSPGNLYRYFASKGALVAGLCERDRVGLSREFEALRESGGNFLEAFRDLGRRHFSDDMCDKAKLCIEIWAEATRNPDVSEMQTAFECTFEDQLVQTFDLAKKNGEIAADVDTRAVASIIGKLGDGLFVRRATAAEFDAEREISQVFAVVGALLKGAVKFPPTSSRSESTS
jgi:AcrR family transcriptional regulator